MQIVSSSMEKLLDSMRMGTKTSTADISWDTQEPACSSQVATSVMFQHTFVGYTELDGNASKDVRSVYRRSNTFFVAGQ
jgi:hypothetical protein